MELSSKYREIEGLAGIFKLKDLILRPSQERPWVIPKNMLFYIIESFEEGIIMSLNLPFQQVLEAADHLSKDEQKKLILILKQKLAQESEEAMAQDQERSREEFAAGLCKPTTPEQLTRELFE